MDVKHIKRIIIGIIFSLLISINLLSQPKFIGDQKLYYGAAYYPEAWDLKTIDEDIEYMKELDMNVMRMAEFSWSWMEPKEGEYHFDWLKKVMDKLYSNGVDVILGTPTATPPAWLGEKYPEIYRVNSDGTRQTHGARRNCSYTSEVYRDYSRIICREMAKALGKHPALIGWQTDNEFNHAPDYSKETEKRWQQWLKKRYGTIDTLNTLWCTSLWSQTYNDFSQVPMPVDRVNHHPSLEFAWYRFTNDMIVEFQDIQLDVIREYSDAPVTHDGMPGQRTDYEKLFAGLDYMSVNNYHSFEAYDRIQSNYDRMRGYRRGYHWLFETAPNNSGGGRKGNTWFLHQPDGSMRAAMWMNFASGGQGLMFWLWRQHWAGQEMPHGAMIHSWGAKAANWDDLAQLGEELKKTSDFLMQNPVDTAYAAVFWSHENLKGLSMEEYANGIKYYNDWTYRFYRPIADAYIHRDVINQGVDISRYKLLFAPLLPYITKDLRSRLKNWVKAGGILVLGPMSGYRTEEWTSFTDHAIGDIEEWAGIEVTSRIPVGTKRREAEIPLILDFDKELVINNHEARLWSEALVTVYGKKLAVYKNGMHDGENAIIENKVGRGKVVLLGTDPGKEAYQTLALKYAKEAGIKPLASGDGEVVIVPREGKEKGVCIVNIANKKKNIKIGNKQYMDLITEKKITHSLLTLEPYEVMILKEL